ncbi:MAG: hypothetical protein HYX22_01360 [Candidatus Yanofskybacteria bacterium]|nr:hypothetical protein [Candidatus Yanofskybacteria bacterium]
MEKSEERARFLKLFNDSPQMVKNLLTSLDTAEKIINTGKTFELDEFDTEALSFAVRKIAAGEVFIGGGVELIAHGVGLPSERAKNLLGLIVNEVFAPALEDIKKIQTAKFPQRFGAPSSVAAQTSQTQIRPPVKQPEPAQSDNPNVINLRNRQN